MFRIFITCYMKKWFKHLLFLVTLKCFQHNHNFLAILLPSNEKKNKYYATYMNYREFKYSKPCLS